MPTTTKMGIVYPSSTDLVKDGATAMGTISTTVDAKTGLILINTTSFTSVASQSFNDVFSANYTNYLIRGSIVDTSATDVTFRLRVAGSDNSSSNYRFSRIYAGNTNAQALFAEVNQTSTSFKLGDMTARGGLQFSVFSPFETQLTTFHFNQNAGYHLYTSGTMTVTTSYTGFTIIAGSSMTGELSVYGYNK